MNLCNREIVCLHGFSWWLMNEDWNTHKVSHICLQLYLPTVPQRSPFLTPFSRSVNFQVENKCLSIIHHLWSFLIARALAFESTDQFCLTLKQQNHKKLTSVSWLCCSLSYVKVSQNELSNISCVSYSEICLHILKTKSKPFPDF